MALTEEQFGQINPYYNFCYCDCSHSGHYPGSHPVHSPEYHQSCSEPHSAYYSEYYSAYCFRNSYYHQA